METVGMENKGGGNKEDKEGKIKEIQILLSEWEKNMHKTILDVIGEEEYRKVFFSEPDVNVDDDVRKKFYKLSNISEKIWTHRYMMDINDIILESWGVGKAVFFSQKLSEIQRKYGEDLLFNFKKYLWNNPRTTIYKFFSMIAYAKDEIPKFLMKTMCF